MPDLLVIKLVTGENIIGIVEDNGSMEKYDEEYDVIFIRNPMQILKQYDSANCQHHMSLIEWIPETDDILIPIPKNMIMTVTTPTQIIMDVYNDLTSELFIEQIDTKDQKKEYQLRLLKEYNPTKEEMQ